MGISFLVVLGASILAPPPAPAIDSSIHFERAKLAWSAKKYEEALAEYDAILKLTGEDGPVRNNRALCFLVLGQFERALWEAERAIELAPAEGQFRITAAVIRMTMKPPDLKAAREDLMKSLKHLKRAKDHQGLGNACYNLGVIAQTRHKYEEASSWYRQALRHDSSNADAREALRILDPESGG